MICNSSNNSCCDVALSNGSMISGTGGEKLIRGSSICLYERGGARTPVLFGSAV